MKRRKSFAVLMAVVTFIMSGCIWMYAYSKSQEVTPNILLLDSILNNRSWIIDSLVESDFSNNPYTELITGATEESFMEEVLSNYQNDEAFKLLVDGMETYKNTGRYATNWTQELIAVLLHSFGLLDDEELIDYVDNQIKSVDDLQYEDIVNAVLAEDYTSSWGSTLFEADSNLEQYRQMSKTLKNLSGYQQALKDNSNLLASGCFNSAQDFTDYTDHFLTAYEDTLYDALINLPNCQQFAENEALTKKIIGVSALAFALKAQTYDPTKLSEEGSDAQGSRISEIYNDYFASEINALLKVSGKALEIGSVATEYAMLLEALMAQQDTTVQVMERIRYNTSDTSLTNTLNMYSDMVRDQGNTQALAYDVIIDYVNRQDVVGNAVLSGAGQAFNKYLNLRCGYFDANKMVMTNAISENLIRAGKCVQIAVWVADKATNIQETSQKIYICKYIDKLIKAAVATYQSDFQAYTNNKTDDNAKRVLDDLEFLKKLRLYGEKQAYGSVCSQTESIVGILLGGDEVQEDIDARYQGNVDALLGCTLSPTSNLEFSVNAGETLDLFAYKLNNGAYTAYGKYTKADGTLAEFPEADMILMSSLTLNGGTVNLYGGEAGIALFVPTLKNTKTSVLNVNGSNVAVGAVENSGTLTITIGDASSGLQFTDSVRNSGTLTVRGVGQSFRVQTVDNSGTWNLVDSTANVYGNLNNDGAVSGKINVCGDGSQAYENSYTAAEVQELSGSGNFTDLYFTGTANKGVQISGSLTVSRYLSCEKTRLRNSENLVITGNCALANNYFKNSLTFEDYTSGAPITLGGTGVIKGQVTFGSATTFNDGLSVTGSCSTLTLNGETTVKGDMQYAGGTIIGGDWLKLYGNLNVTTSSPSIEKLMFAGLLPQTVSASSSLTVSELENQNKSLSGVDFSSKIYVTGTLSSGSTSVYENGKNIVLTETAGLNGNTIRGSLSAENWTCTDAFALKGTLYASGAITLRDGAALTALSYQQSGGTLSVSQNAVLQSEGDLLLGGATTNNGTVLGEGDAKITAAFTGGTLKVKGDLAASASLTPDTLVFDAKVPQSFSNSGTTTVQNLQIINPSGGGFTVGSVINVTGRFNNDCKNLIHGENIHLSGDSVYVDNNLAKGDFTVSGTYTVKSGDTLTVNGKLYLQKDATLIVEDGASLLVKRSLISNGATLLVESGGAVEITDYWSSSSDTVQVDGTLTVKGDAKLSSAAVSASGLLTFKGDLTVSGGTWNNPNVAFISKLPQVVSGSAISVGNLTVDNLSRTGIQIDAKITPSGTVQYIHMSADDAAA